jgi:hypothetical protein
MACSVADRLHKRPAMAFPIASALRITHTRRAHLHVGDLIALGIVFSGAVTASSDLLGTRHDGLRAALIIGWACSALRRIVAWRGGEYQHITIEGPSKTIALVVGVTPWFMLPLVHGRFQDWAIWTPVPMPFPLRIIGAALLMAGVFAPFWLALSSGTGAFGPSPLRLTSNPTGPTVDAFAHAVGLFLLSASPLVGVLVGLWLVLTFSVDRVKLAVERYRAWVIVSEPIVEIHP